MTLLCMFALSLPVIAFVLAVLVLCLLALSAPKALWIHKNRKVLAHRLFRKTGWGWPLYLATVGGGTTVGSGTTVGITMNVGYPGTYSRNGDCVIPARQVTVTDATGPNFGDAVFFVQNGTSVTLSSAAALVANSHVPVITQGANYCFAGIAIREVKTALSYLSQNTINYYAPGDTCDYLSRGAGVPVIYSNPLSAALPIAGGQVYMRISTNGAGTAVGAFESAADGGHTIALPGCFWTTGVVDANSVIEISILSRNTP